MYKILGSFWDEMPINGVIMINKNRIKNIPFVLIVFFIFTNTSLLAQTIDYHDQEKRGFYNYKDPKEPEKEKEPEKTEPEPIVSISNQSALKSDTSSESQSGVTPKTTLIRLKDYTQEELWSMHPKKIKELLNDLNEQAIAHLDEQSVKDALIMRDLARRKADAFANMTALVLQKNPDLSLENEYPLIKSGQDKLRSKRLEMVDTVLKNISTEWGLLFFNDTDCHSCPSQQEMLTWLKNEYRDFEIVESSISSPLASFFNISEAPVIIIIHPESSRWMSVSNGAIPYSTLKRNIVNAYFYLTNQIKPEQYGILPFEVGSGFDPLSHLEGTTTQAKKTSSSEEEK